MPPVAKVFETIGTAKVATSAEEAREHALPAPGRRHHHEPRPPARRRQGERRSRSSPTATSRPRRSEAALPGASGRAALDMAVAGFRASGGDRRTTSWSPASSPACSPAATPTSPTRSPRRSARLEREAFLALVRTPATLARIEHMLETGKPLRN
jgi:3-hydroxyacyl-CoA dehydrogenase